MLTAAHILSSLALLAQAGPVTDNVSSSATWEFDPVEGALGWGVLIGCFVAVGFVIWLTLRDTRSLSRAWTVWLAGLRMLFLGALFLIALNPHIRTQKESYRPSQVVFLVDTSTSMQQSATDPESSEGGHPRSRYEAVMSLLSETDLLDRLRQHHTIDIYAFDSDLSQSLVHLPMNDGDAESGADNPPTAASNQPDWKSLLEPDGNSTRLGDAVDKLLAEVKSPTLSGVVVMSDGALNVGRDVKAANQRAKAAGVRLIAVGTGGTQPPRNIQMVKVIAPTDVHLPRTASAETEVDPFEITGFLQSTGLGGTTVSVDLLRQFAGESNPTVMETKKLTLPEGDETVSVSFMQLPFETGKVDYTVAVRPPDGVVESRDDDNRQTRTINVFDEPLHVLIVAGGPMRDYRFSRIALHRHASMKVDIWLQTGTVGISQDANEIIFRFPETREELFKYDVVLAFDPDWSLIPDEAQQWLEEWVANEGGGLILVAGDVYTKELAAADSMDAIRNLYPVLLQKTSLRASLDQARQPWKLGLTQEGQAADFLKLDDGPANIDVWEEFPGVFRCYPTLGRKGGATVYAEFTDPAAVNSARQEPVLIAGQRYSQGQTMYLGSPEIWRLRSLNEDFYDRFWVKLVRKAAEGRTKRGLQRGMLILEGANYDVGQTVPVRARVLDAQFRPLEQDAIDIDVYDPEGAPLIPAPKLARDPNRPSEFVGDFRVSIPGRYKLELEVPELEQRVTSDISVSLPALEMSQLRQDVTTLRELVVGTGGEYLPLPEAGNRLAELLPNMGQQIIVDQQIRELWDRLWVLLALIGLLGAEWLTRKLLKLA